MWPVICVEIEEKPEAEAIISALSSMKHEYGKLGIFLGIKLNKIREFQKYTGDVETCMNQVVYHWLNMEDEADEDEETSKTETFFEALEAVGNKGLAYDLREKYKGRASPHYLMFLFSLLLFFTAVFGN